MTSPEDIPGLMDSQRRFFKSGATRDLTMRLAALQKLQHTLQDREGDLLEALRTDLGKPEIEAFLSEYHFLLQELRLVQRSLRRWLKPRRAKSPVFFLPCRNKIQRAPFGVTLVMAPWNYPIQLSLAPLIASIAAGNTVILKPSELTPACEAFLRRLIADCFVPEHACVITGGADTSSTLLDQRFDFLLFTGSTKIGRIVARKAAEHLTPHILELGGKCPCVVDAGTDLPLAARRILTAKLFNAGQTCFAPDFVIAHESIRDNLARELAKLLDQHPWELEMARIINDQHYQRLQSLLEDPVISKGVDQPEALHFAPRLLPQATWESPSMQEEIFGPILPILGFRNQSDLLDHLGTQSSPLALYCFSKDQAFIDSLLSRIPSGGVCINDIGKQASNLHVPFGGVGESGHGRYRGKSGVEAFTYERAVTTRYFLPDPFELLPPREKMTRMLRKWLS